MLNQTFIDAGTTEFKSTVQYGHFLAAWYSYVELLDIDYTDGFQCSACGPHPSLVIMDATALSFRRQLDFWGNIPTTGASKEIEVVSRKSRYSLDTCSFCPYRKGNAMNRDPH